MSRKSPFPQIEVEKLIKDLEVNQGCIIKKKTNGYWVGFPNGQSTTIHLSTSDYRAKQNSRAIILRNGCTWPL